MQAPLYHVFSDKDSLARHFGAMLQKLSIAQEKVYLALSGGSTPQHIFDILATEFIDLINWERLIVFWVDERCVPPTHDESNYRMTQKHLLSKVPISPQNIFRIKGELSPNDANEQYLDDLMNTVPLVNEIPQFDLTVLGMGDDGHTASIFPHEIVLWHSPNNCELGHHPQSGQTRVTLTGRVINHSQHIVFLVTGNNKAIKVSEIFNHSSSSKSYPASFVETSKSTWLFDAQAAALL